MDQYHSFSYDGPGFKTSPAPGITNWNNRSKKGRIHFVGKMTQVSDQGPRWPSCFVINFSNAVSLRTLPFTDDPLTTCDFNNKKSNGPRLDDLTLFKTSAYYAPAKRMFSGVCWNTPVCPSVRPCVRLCTKY